MSEFNLLSPSEDDKFKTVIIQKKYKFKIKYIAPKDKLDIGKRRNIFNGGMHMDTLSAGEYNLAYNMAVVDTCTIEFPEDFSTSSCREWEDETLINELAEAIEKHTNEFEAKLKKNRLIGGSSKE